MSASGETVPPRRVLFIANGHGEDSIAAAIIALLPAHIAAEAYPVVGSGKAYDGLCRVVGPRAHIPSEGWRHTRGSVARDIRGGMLASIRPALRFLGTVRGGYDAIVAVGDLVAPLLCWLAGLKIDIYLDVFKSGYAHRYSLPERFVLRRAARKIYCRDDILASALRAAGINAVSAGNIMLDTVPYNGFDPAPYRRHVLMVTLMPGSRVWTAESLNLQIAALKLLPGELQTDIFVALAPGLDAQELADATDTVFNKAQGTEAAYRGALSDGALTLHLVTGAAGDLVAASDLVLSQAGTGTQQALGLGKPVITFNRAGNRPKRMADEQALMGEARLLVAEDPQAVADAMTALLGNEAERERLGAIGRARLGGPGTLAAVIADLSG